MDDRHDEVFKAFADPSRRRIVAALCNEPMVAGDLAAWFRSPMPSHSISGCFRRPNSSRFSGRDVFSGIVWTGRCSRTGECTPTACSLFRPTRPPWMPLTRPPEYAPPDLLKPVLAPWPSGVREGSR